MARPGRLELPTLCLEGRRSIQLSYGRVVAILFNVLRLSHLLQGQLARSKLSVPNFVPTQPQNSVQNRVLGRMDIACGNIDRGVPRNPRQRPNVTT
jgi:hypothetical protein